MGLKQAKQAILKFAEDYYAFEDDWDKNKMKELIDEEIKATEKELGRKVLDISSLGSGDDGVLNGDIKIEGYKEWVGLDIWLDAQELGITFFLNDAHIYDEESGVDRTEASALIQVEDVVKRGDEKYKVVNITPNWVFLKNMNKGDKLTMLPSDFYEEVKEGNIVKVNKDEGRNETSKKVKAENKFNIKKDIKVETETDRYGEKTVVHVIQRKFESDDEMADFIRKTPELFEYITDVAHAKDVVSDLKGRGILIDELEAYGNPEEYRNIEFEPGDRVKVVDGVGTISNKNGVVVDRFNWREEHGAYQKPSWDEIPVQFDDGKKSYVPQDYLLFASKKVKAGCERAGVEVEVETPSSDDLWKHSFKGVIVDSKEDNDGTKMWVIEDQEGNVWDVEQYKVKLLANKGVSAMNSGVSELLDVICEYVENISYKNEQHMISKDIEDKVIEQLNKVSGILKDVDLDIVPGKVESSVRTLKPNEADEDKVYYDLNEDELVKPKYSPEVGWYWAIWASPDPEEEREAEETAEEIFADPDDDDPDKEVEACEETKNVIGEVLSLYEKHVVDFDKKEIEGTFEKSDNYKEFKKEALNLLTSLVDTEKITGKDFGEIVDKLEIKLSEEELNKIVAQKPPKPTTPPPDNQKWAYDAELEDWILVAE